MEVKYFKEGVIGDCYVANNDFMNVVVISKESVCLMACDDSNLEGLYKPLKIKKRDYNALSSAAIDKDREKMTGLLKKIHKENEGVLNSGVLQIQEITDILFDGDYGSRHKVFESKNPILE